MTTHDKKYYAKGEPCRHKGCLSHVSHPCEGCGRIAGGKLDHPVGKYSQAKMTANDKCPKCGVNIDMVEINVGAGETIKRPSHIQDGHDCTRNQLANVTAERDEVRGMITDLQWAVDRVTGILDALPTDISDYFSDREEYKRFKKITDPYYEEDEEDE